MPCETKVIILIHFKDLQRSTTKDSKLRICAGKKILIYYDLNIYTLLSTLVINQITYFILLTQNTY